MFIYPGNTCRIVGIVLYAGPPQFRQKEKTTHCVIVFVAMDEKTKTAIPVPKWVPQTPKEKAMEDYAKRLMELRKGIDQEMQKHIME